MGWGDGVFSRGRVWDSLLFLPSHLNKAFRHAPHEAVTTPVLPALIFLATPPGLRLYFLGSVSAVSTHTPRFT